MFENNVINWTDTELSNAIYKNIIVVYLLIVMASFSNQNFLQPIKLYYAFCTNKNTVKNKIYITFI